MNLNLSIAPVSNALEVESCKAIVMKIAGHLLAIPVSTVFKIIRSSLTYSSNLGSSTILHLDEKTFPTIDLHDILIQIKPSNNLGDRSQSLSEDDKIFVLARSTNGNLSAIIVDEPPTLMDLPLQNTYLLPSNELNKINNIASHVAVVPFQRSNLTIFLLDIQQALIAIGFNDGHFT